MEFGEVLKDIRLKNGWTMEEMAAKLGTTKQAISNYESGKRTPKITVAANFAEILGVPLEFLVGYEYHEDDPVVLDKDKIPITTEARILAKGIDQMSKEQREAVINLMNGLYPGLFEKGSEK